MIKLLACIIVFIPLYICFGIWSMLGPITFWEIFATAALMVFFGGSTQMGFIVLAVMLSGVIITEL